MYEREKAIVALSQQLPSTEVLTRLQTCYRKLIAMYNEGKEVPAQDQLSQEQIDRIHQEIAHVITSPLGTDLMIELLPVLIHVSNEGAKHNNAVDI